MRPNFLPAAAEPRPAPRRVQDLALNLTWFRANDLQISLKPSGAEFHGMAAMGRICQTVVSALKDTNLFRGTQVMKDLPCLIEIS